MMFTLVVCAREMIYKHTNERVNKWNKLVLADGVKDVI